GRADGTAAAIRQTAVLLLGLAAETYGESLGDQQEVVMLVADLIMDAFGADSAVRRAAQAEGPLRALHEDAVAVFVHDAGLRAEAAARTAVAAMTTGDASRTAQAALRRVLKIAPENTVAARRRIADAIVAQKRYPFGIY